MGVVEIVARALGLKQWSLVTGGLSTEKFRVGDRLYRIYQDSSRAEAEARALELLKGVESHGLEFPRFIEQIQVEEFHVNVVAWVEGEPLEVGMSEVVEVARKFPNLAGTGLPLHRELVTTYVQNTIPIAEGRNREMLEGWLRSADIPAGDVLCHGDLHAGNMIRTERGVGVIDWEYAAAGHPGFDTAYACCYHLAELGEEGFTKEFSRIVELSDDSLELWRNAKTAAVTMACWFIRRHRQGGRLTNLNLAARYLEWQTNLNNV